MLKLLIDGAENEHLEYTFPNLSENHDCISNEGHNTQDMICTHIMNFHL